MTETTSDTLEALADGLFAAPISRDRAIAALRDAFELGQLAATPTTPPPTPARTALGLPTDPEKRAGLMVQTVHLITADKVAEHGAETVIMAWIQQTLRQIAANGGNPAIDATVSVTGMDDGAITITGEGRLIA